MTGAARDKFPIADPSHGVGFMLPHAILNEDPYPIKVLFAFRYDPLLSQPGLQHQSQGAQEAGSDRGQRCQLRGHHRFGGCGFTRIIFFWSVSDPLQMGSSLKPAINRRIACVEPRFDTKPMWWIVKQLADRLGAGHYFSL